MTVMFITWDANTPVSTKPYVLVANWRFAGGWIESVSPYHPNAGVLVNGKPWSPEMTLTCGDVLTYQATKPFPNPATVKVDLIMGSEPCPEPTPKYEGVVP